MASTTHEKVIELCYLAVKYPVANPTANPPYFQKPFLSLFKYRQKRKLYQKPFAEHINRNYQKQ